MNFILRKTTAVLAALAMLVLSAAIPLSAYADTDGYGEIIFETDFENGLGVNNKDLQWKSDGGARTPVEMLSPVDEEEHGKIVGVPTMGSNGKRDHFLRTSYAKVNGKFESAMLTGEALERVQHIRLGMDIMMGDYADAGFSIVTHQSVSSRPSYRLVSFTDKGGLSVLGVSHGNYELMTWYRLEAFLDYTKREVQVYIGGEPAGSAPMNDNFGFYCLSTGVQMNANAADTYVYVDNLTYRVASAPALLSAYPPDGYRNAPIKGGTLELIFDSSLDANAFPGVTVQNAAGQTVDGVDYEIRGAKLILTVTQKLEPDTGYTVQIPAGVTGKNGLSTKEPIRGSFHTAAGALLLGEFTYTEGTSNPDGGQAAVRAELISNSDTTQTALVVIAAYDAQGAMLGVKEEPVTVESGQTVSMDSRISTTESVDHYCAYVAGANGVPVGGRAICLSGEGTKQMDTLAGERGDAEITLFEVDENAVRIAGTLSKAGQQLLIVRVERQGETVWIAPILSDSSGSFTAGYAAAAAEDGYKLILTGQMLNRTATQMFYYFKPETKAQILESVNGAASVSAVKTALTPYQDKLDIKEGAFCQAAFEALHEQKPITSFEEMLKTMNQAFDLLETLNQSTWSDMSGLLIEQEATLLKNHADMSYYKGLNGTERNKVCRYLIKRAPFADFAALRTAFGQAIDDYQEYLKTNSDNNNNRPGGSGGGGGGRALGGNYIQAVEKDPQPSDTPSETPSETPEQTEISFTDLDQAAWARDSILSLAGRGYLSGDGDGKFRPNDAITREEFVKLLLCGLKIDPVNKESGFTDAVKNAWYEPYLAAAKAAGIVTGDPGGSFGIGQQITRQDMAVMVFRAVEMTEGQRPAAQSAEFQGQSQISAYAADAVNWMYQETLISGMGDHTFAPLENASRAQAAKVMEGLLQWRDGRNHG